MSRRAPDALALVLVQHRSGAAVAVVALREESGELRSELDAEHVQDAGLAAATALAALIVAVEPSLLSYGSVPPRRLLRAQRRQSRSLAAACARYCAAIVSSAAACRRRGRQQRRRRCCRRSIGAAVHGGSEVADELAKGALPLSANAAQADIEVKDGARLQRPVGCALHQVGRLLVERQIATVSVLIVVVLVGKGDEIVGRALDTDDAEPDREPAAAPVSCAFLEGQRRDAHELVSTRARLEVSAVCRYRCRGNPQRLPEAPAGKVKSSRAANCDDCRFSGCHRRVGRSSGGGGRYGCRSRDRPVGRRHHLRRLVHLAEDEAHVARLAYDKRDDTARATARYEHMRGGCRAHARVAEQSGWARRQLLGHRKVPQDARSGSLPPPVAKVMQPIRHICHAEVLDIPGRDDGEGRPAAGRKGAARCVDAARGEAGEDVRCRGSTAKTECCQRDKNVPIVDRYHADALHVRLSSSGDEDVCAAGTVQRKAAEDRAQVSPGALRPHSAPKRLVRSVPLKIAACVEHHERGDAAYGARLDRVHSSAQQVPQRQREAAGIW